MTEPSKKETQTKQSDKVKPTVLLTATALDTTWRIFVPVLVGALVGIAVDRALHTVIIWTLILLVVGAVIAGYLVYRQLKGIRS